MAEVIFSPRAARDVDEIGAYLEKLNPQASDKIIQRILDTCRRLESHLQSGRPGRVAETRELVVPGTSYIVPYRVRAGRVEILAIFHAARDWPELL